MSSLVGSIRAKSWVLKITLMGLVLGMLLAMSLKGQQKVIGEITPTGRGSVPEMIAAVRDAKRESLDLRKQNEELTKRLNDRGPGNPNLIKDLTEAQVFGGLKAVKGPGVVVTLKDSTKITGTEGLIHDSDIRSFVDELLAAGAEVISVNDQRLVSNSAIRCVGPLTRINNTSVAPPYVIKAIGDPVALEGALKLPGGVLSSFTDTDMIKFEQSKELTMKAYDGVPQFKFAKPILAAN